MTSTICQWTDRLPQDCRAAADAILVAAARAGVLSGDLTPECATVVGAVLDALSAPAGAADCRTHEQRYHDALQEAMRRLLAAGLLPERAGQPVKALAHVSLADLMLLEGSSALLEEWTAGVRAEIVSFLKFIACF